MLLFGPILGSPILSLSDDDMPAVTITGMLQVEARIQNPLQDLLSNPNARLIIAAEIHTLPVG